MLNRLSHRCSLGPAIRPGDIVFAGNSLTEAFPVAELFGPHVQNHGIGGNQTSHILARIGLIAAAKPLNIFLEVGINDLFNRVSRDTIMQNYVAIVHKIQGLSPDAQLYISRFSLFAAKNRR
jgi:lysophospholipase L1-like esterase